MKKYFIIFCSLFFLFKNDLHSQTPGYMGKRVIVGYNNYFIPAFLYASSRSDKFHINVTHTLNIDFIAGSKRMICLNFIYLNTGISVYDDQFYNAYYGTSEQNRINIAKISSTGISFGIKRMSNKKLAPLGFYKKWEVVYLSNQVKYDLPRIAEPNGYYFQGGQGVLKSISFGGGYGIGFQRVIFDKFVIDYGVRATVVLPTLALPRSKESSDNQELNSLIGRAGDRITYHQFINFRIGIGFLAF